MLNQPKWREKRDRDNKVIPGCWVTDSGYTVALCRLPENRYTITRPGGAAPFAYTGDREDIVPLIRADAQATAEAFPDQEKIGAVAAQIDELSRSGKEGVSA